MAFFLLLILGPVSSVGDVNCQVKFKHSAPNLPLRWDPVFSKGNETRTGSNVTDGTHRNFLTNAGPPIIKDSNWEGDRHFKIRHGWIYQDMREQDRTIQPWLGATPDYSWNNRVATIYNAKHTGEKFLPLPGQYALSPGEVVRGGSFPRVTQVTSGDVMDTVEDPPSVDNGINGPAKGPVRQNYTAPGKKTEVKKPGKPDVKSKRMR